MQILKKNQLLLSFNWFYLILNDYSENGNK